MSRFALGALAVAAAMLLSPAAQAAVTNDVQLDLGNISLPLTQGFSNTFIGSAGSFVDAKGNTIADTLTLAGKIYNFYDDYLFTMPSQGGLLSASAITVDLGNVLNIDNFQIRLYVAPTNGDLTTGVPANGTLISGWQSAVANGGYTYDISGLAGGVDANTRYAVEVRGYVSGINGGSYGGNFNISPVPEPATWTLALAGLGVGFLVLGRRRNTRH